jgi:hypothetical protein
MIINDDMVDDDYMSFIIIYSFSIVFFLMMFVIGLVVGYPSIIISHLWLLFFLKDDYELVQWMLGEY